METRVSNKSKLQQIGAVGASAALALCLFGCSSSGSSDQGSGDAQNGAQQEQQASEEQQPQKETQYYDECAEMPTVDSTVDATQNGGMSTSSSYANGIATTTYKYAYTMNGDDTDRASNQLDAYLAKLSEAGLTATEEAEDIWSVTDADSEEVATLEYDSSAQTLTVSIIDASNRSTIEEIALNTPVTTDDYTFTLTSIEWNKEVLPPDTSQTYNYYKEQPNKTYCIIKGTFKYTGSSQFDMGDTTVQFTNMNGQYEFSGSAEYAYDMGWGLSSVTNMYSFAPLDEVQLYIYASIPDEVADNFTGGSMDWTFLDGNQYRLNFA